MSDDSVVSINDKCEVLLENGIYKSNIQEITEKYIAISLPVSNGVYATPYKGDMVEIICYNNKKVYSFISTVIGRKKDAISMILITKPNDEDIKRVQRRKNFRVELVEKIKYKVLDRSQIKDEVENLKKHSNELLDAILLDISGGGLKIKTKEKSKVGDVIFINMPLKKEKIFLVSTCIRTVVEANGEYIYGLQFYDIDDKEREHIIAYTFDIMRERMKKR